MTDNPRRSRPTPEATPSTAEKTVVLRLLPRWSLIRYRLFLLVLTGVLCFNATRLWKETSWAMKVRTRIPVNFPGLKFSGLNLALPGVRFIGYHTDKDRNEKANATQFAQAQYVLAPIVLLEGYEHFEYVIFDFSDEKTALKRVAERQFIPVKKSLSGLVLGRDPTFRKNREDQLKRSR